MKNIDVGVSRLTGCGRLDFLLFEKSSCILSIFFLHRISVYFKAAKLSSVKISPNILIAAMNAKHLLQIRSISSGEKYAGANIRKPGVDLQRVSYDLQTGPYDLQTAIYDLQTTIYDLQTTIYDLQTAIYDLQTTIYDLQTAIYDLQMTIYDLQTAIYDLQTVSYDLQRAFGFLKKYAAIVQMTKSLRIFQIFSKLFPVYYEIPGKNRRFFPKIGGK